MQVAILDCMLGNLRCGLNDLHGRNGPYSISIPLHIREALRASVVPCSSNPNQGRSLSLKRCRMGSFPDCSFVLLSLTIRLLFCHTVLSFFLS